MTVTYFVSVSISLFAGVLPAQILGVLWENVCESLRVEIPYIALLRLLGGAGAVAAVILSDRIRGYILARDLIVGSIALEAMSLIGFSMSREFWNLAVWITALGFSLGLCMSAVCLQRHGGCGGILPGRVYSFHGKKLADGQSGTGDSSDHPLHERISPAKDTAS